MVAVEAVVTILIIVTALVLFVTEIFAPEVVALGVMAALILTGVVSPEEGVSGFSNEATVAILALFIIADGIYRTGVLSVVSRRLVAVTGTSEFRLLLLITAVAGVSSAFMANTAVVAVLMPLVLTLARESHVSPSKLLMPLSHVAVLAGTLTLVGTTTNIVASALVKQETGEPLGMFEFTRVGAVLFVVGTFYLLLVGRHLIPARIKEESLVDRYHLKDYLAEVKVLPGSPLVGLAVERTDLKGRFDVDVIRIIRGALAIEQPVLGVPLHEGDVLVIRASQPMLLQLRQAEGLDPIPGVKDTVHQRLPDVSVVEIVVSPGSRLHGRSLRDIRFRQRYNASVLAVNKREHLFLRRLHTTRLEVGDTLLVLADTEAVERLRADPAFIVGKEAPAREFRKDKAALALAILAGVVLLPALDVLGLMPAAVAGAALVAFGGVLKREELWRAIRWDVIVLLVGLFPMGIALQNTGIADAIGAWVAGAASGLPYLGIIALFWFGSMVLTELLSNTGTVILLIPIAFATAAGLGIPALPLILAVTFAASVAFMTPFGYQTNLMVYGPGGYRFTDFTKVGAPLNLIMLIAGPYAIYVFYPLSSASA
ncbi:MAG: SLC13 family permease [Methanobacteriota archaeon]